MALWKFMLVWPVPVYIASQITAVYENHDQPRPSLSFDRKPMRSVP